MEPPLIAKMSRRPSATTGKALATDDDVEDMEEEEVPMQTQAPLDFYTQAVDYSAGMQAPLLYTQAAEPLATQPPPSSINPFDSSGFAASPPVLPKSSPEESSADKEESEDDAAPEEAQGKAKVEEPLTKISFMALKAIINAAEEGLDTIFDDRDKVIQACYAKYEEFCKELAKEDNLLPLEQLIPKASSPLPKRNKSLQYADEDEEVGPENKVPTMEESPKKKSLLLPNFTSKRVQWDSLSPSSPAGSSTPKKEKASAALQSDEDVVLESPEKKENTPEEAANAAATQQAPESSGMAAFELKKEKTNRNVTGRRAFSDAEVGYLKEGLRKFGKNWKIILNAYPFNDRTGVDLKDKARNLVKRGEINL